MSRRALVVVALGLALLAGCGGSDPPAAPRMLPADLLPATIPDPTDPANPIALVEFPAARERFANAGSRSLVDDGRLWELRRGSNLIGTVEVGTLKAKVDLSSEAQRKELVSVLLPGTTQAIKVRGIGVVRAAADDKVTYLVLGRDLFQLTDVKIGDRVDPAHVIDALLEAEVPTGHLTAAGPARRRPL